jgi:hypothetical protein
MARCLIVAICLLSSNKTDAWSDTEDSGRTFSTVINPDKMYLFITYLFFILASRLKMRDN